jgi:hypothetical protein
MGTPASYNYTTVRRVIELPVGRQTQKACSPRADAPVSEECRAG